MSAGEEVGSLVCMLMVLLGGGEGWEEEEGGGRGGSRPSFTTWFNLEWTRATFAILLRLPNSLQTIIVAHGAVLGITSFGGTRSSSLPRSLGEDPRNSA